MLEQHSSLLRPALCITALALGAHLVAACRTDAPSDRTDTSAPGLSPPALATDALFDDLAVDSPGCSVAVGRADRTGTDPRILYARGFGSADLETGRSIEPTTVFDIASTSKQFTATEILLLASEGRLSLDDSLSEHLGPRAPWTDRVTLRDLLHHTSGVPDYSDLLEQDYSEPTTQDDALAALWDAELNADPGSAFEYSNSNYILLAEVIERIERLGLADIFQRRIFGPLGLDMVLDPTGEVPRKAVAYARDEDDWEIEGSLWEQVGDGAVQTTPTELVTWSRQYWDPTLGGPGITAARRRGAVPTGEGDSYGAGVIYGEMEDGTEAVYHSGSWAGFVTDWVVIPAERLAVAVTCNSETTKAPEDPAFAVAELWRS